MVVMGRGNVDPADHPANRVLFDFLRAQARRPSDPADSSYAIDEWRPHTHPDLLERLEELAPDGIPIIPLGLPALAVDGVVAAAGDLH
ncbi:hypothetical protein ACRYCC_40335 [Actinomadura scrupuli]|uniref:hypothetical protein n=1 Tax=Actinomadura scrupuli TaxID=559629 RepID=UPI003D96B39A